MDTKIKNSNQVLFTKKNYILMAIGILVIALGFFLMTGADANTRPDGIYDPNYWNKDIFSWKRIRLAPTLITIGFIIEIIAILYQPKNK